MSQMNAIPQAQVYKSSPLAEAARAHPLTAYFLLAFAGTWLVFLPTVLGRGFGLFDLPDALAFALFIVSTFTGPMLAAVLVTGALDGKAGVKALLRRIVQFRGPGWWYLVVLLGYPLVATVGLLPIVGLAAYASVWKLAPALVTAFLPAILFNLVMPALGEETGWRGFALPRLERLHGPLVGSLILGALHALWHLPAYLVPGFMRPGPFDLNFFLVNSLAIIVITILWTWLNNHARGSIFFAMLVHASSNALSAPLMATFGDINPGLWFSAALFGAVALIVVIATRGRLGYRPETMPA